MPNDRLWPHAVCRDAHISTHHGWPALSKEKDIRALDDRHRQVVCVVAGR